MGNFLLQCQLSVLILTFIYLFHPCIIAVALKSSWSFSQKYKWQVTTKHIYVHTTHVALNKVAQLYVEHSMCTEIAAGSHGTSYTVL